MQSGQGRPIAVLMIDVDHFKIVNDQYGHANGDLALKLIADVFRNNIRAFDSLARYGGDEFVVVMPGSNPDDATTYAKPGCASPRWKRCCLNRYPVCDTDCRSVSAYPAHRTRSARRSCCCTRPISRCMKPSGEAATG